MDWSPHTCGLIGAGGLWIHLCLNSCLSLLALDAWANSGSSLNKFLCYFGYRMRMKGTPGSWFYCTDSLRSYTPGTYQIPSTGLQLPEHRNRPSLFNMYIHHPKWCSSRCSVKVSASHRHELLDIRLLQSKLYSPINFPFEVKRWGVAMAMCSHEELCPRIWICKLCWDREGWFEESLEFKHCGCLFYSWPLEARTAEASFTGQTTFTCHLIFAAILGAKVIYIATGPSHSQSAEALTLLPQDLRSQECTSEAPYIVVLPYLVMLCGFDLVHPLMLLPETGVNVVWKVVNLPFRNRWKSVACFISWKV